MATQGEELALITVVFVSGSEVCMQTSLAAPLRAFVYEISISSGLAPSQCNLLLEQQPLSEMGRSLKEYGIQPGSTLTLIVRPLAPEQIDTLYSGVKGHWVQETGELNLDDCSVQDFWMWADVLGNAAVDSRVRRLTLRRVILSDQDACILAKALETGTTVEQLWLVGTRVSSKGKQRLNESANVVKRQGRVISIIGMF